MSADHPLVEFSADAARLGEAQAVVFHLPTLRPKADLPKYPGQLWIAWSMESEVFYPRLDDPVLKPHFDLEMSHRRQADIWMPYLPAVQLLSDNRIGEGRDGQAFYWSVEEDREGLCLNLHGRRRLSAKLRPQADGSWAGRALHGDVFLELSPCLARPSRAAGAVSPVSLSPASVLEHLVVPPPDPAADPGSVSDLAAALRLLARRLPGFAAAMAERLQRSGGQANAALACLKAALADIEASPDSAADPRSGHGTGYRIRNMSRLYEPHS